MEKLLTARAEPVARTKGCLLPAVMQCFGQLESNAGGRAGRVVLGRLPCTLEWGAAALPPS